MILPYILTPEAKVPAADRLRAMFNDDKVRIVPELADCMGAKAAEMNGFEVIMVSSGDLACAMTGIPDLQLLSIDDFVRVTEQITHMTPMPLIIDADDGFGLGRALNAQYGCMRIMQALPVFWSPIPLNWAVRVSCPSLMPACVSAQPAPVWTLTVSMVS